MLNQTILTEQTNVHLGVETFDAAFIATIGSTNGTFGIRVAGEFSDPRLNNDGPGHGPPGEQRGHFVRFYQAFDQEHHAIADTYVVTMDYQGINYHYQDNIYLVKGITPATELMTA